MVSRYAQDLGFYLYPHVACWPTSVLGCVAGFPLLFALYLALYLLFFFLLLSFLCFFSIAFLRNRFRLSSDRLSSGLSSFLLVFLRRFTLLYLPSGAKGSPGLSGKTPSKNHNFFGPSFLLICYVFWLPFGVMFSGVFCVVCITFSSMDFASICH